MPLPFFFLKVRKGSEYHLFNPVDNREYVVNYIEYRILELCDGSHTLTDIAGIIEQDLGKTKTEAAVDTAIFLDKMYKAGIIAWRNRRVNYSKTCSHPSIVFWDITNECNLCCAHCYNPNERFRKDELSNEEIKRILEEISVFGVKKIVFSGGEPLLRKDFLDIANYASSLKFKSIGMATNGTLIDRETARLLRAANLDIQVSIDGDSAEIHDLMRGVKGAFDRAVHGIKLLLEEGNRVSVCTTATKLNVYRIDGIIRLMRDLGIENYRVQSFMPIGRGKMNVETLRLPPRKMKELAEFLQSKNISCDTYEFTLKPPPNEIVDFYESGACSAATYSCSITPEGNIVPCTHFWGMNGDNLRDHSFQWIWENSKLLNYFRSILLDDVKGHCRDCKWLSLCHGGCKAENYANGDIFYSNFNCWVAYEGEVLKHT